MHTLLQTSERSTASSIVERLRAAGIPASLVDYDQIPGGTAHGGFAVMVSEEDAERALLALTSNVPEPAENGDEPSAPAAAESPNTAPPLRERGFWVGLLAVLLAGWAVHVLSAVDGLVTREWASLTPTLVLYEAISALATCAVVWLAAVASGHALTRYGLTRPSFADVGVAVLVLVMAFGVHEASRVFLGASGFGDALQQLYEPIEEGWHRWNWDAFGGGFALVLGGIAWGLHWIVLAAAEEFTFRGFLLPRFSDLLGTKLGATLLSSALFASFHCYQGAHSIVTSFLFGLAFSLGFWLVERVWPLVLAHAVWNMTV